MQRSTIPAPRSFVAVIPLLVLPLLLLVSALFFNLNILPVTAEGLDASCIVPQQADTLLKFDLSAQKSHVKIETVQETMRHLEQIEGPIAVVSVAGMYRTGKSFLLNQLMPQGIPRNVFSVGHTIQPHTEEVSVYIIPPCALTGTPLHGTTALFMDTPGLFAPNRAAIFDSQLMAILNLISSVLVYNTKDVVNRHSIQQLSNAIDAAGVMAYISAARSENGKIQDAAQKDQLTRPHLLWVMQQFALRMEDGRGGSVSSDEYLQKILEQTDESSNHTTSFRNRFGSFFQSQDTAGLPYPSESFREADILDTLPDSKLSPEYKEARETLKVKLFRLLGPKRLGSTILTGSSLVTLMQSWVEEMGNNMFQTPTTPTSTSLNTADALLNHIAKQETDRLVRLYQKALNDVSLPSSESDLHKLNQEIYSKLLAPYSLDTVESSATLDFIAHVKRRFEPLFEEFLKHNAAILQVKYEAALNNVRVEMEEKLKQLTMPKSGQDIKDEENRIYASYRAQVASFDGMVPSSTSKAKAQLDQAIASRFDTFRTTNVGEKHRVVEKDFRADLASYSQKHPRFSVASIKEIGNKYKQEWKDWMSQNGFNTASLGYTSSRLINLIDQEVSATLAHRDELIAHDALVLLEEAKSRFDTMKASPVDMGDLDAVAKDISNRWEAIMLEYNLDINSQPIHPSKMSFQVSLNQALISARAHHQQLSLVECTRITHGLLDQLEYESGQWLKSGYESYRWKQGITMRVQRVVDSLRVLCKNSAWSTPILQQQIERSEARMLFSWQDRTTFGWMILLLVDVVAIWCLFSVARFHRQLQTGKWDSTLAGEVDRWLSRVSFPAAILAAVILYLLPEADPIKNLTIGVVGVLLLSGSVGARLQWLEFKKIVTTSSEKTRV